MNPLSIPCIALAMVAMALLPAAPAGAQRIDLQPASGEVIVGEPLHIALAGLPPQAEVTLVAERAQPDFLGRRLYRAEARFRADADGRVDLATQAPASGSYSGADLRGLFWSMRPVPQGDASALADGEVRLQVQRDGQPLARQSLRLRLAAADLQQRDATAFPGARLFWREGQAGRRPALIALGGSEGGSVAVGQAARLLASHGYAVLALPYHSPPRWGATGPLPPELPALPAAFADIAVDRLQAARDWLAQQPEVDPDRIGLYGVSKGAELALIAASRMNWPRSVVAIVPSDVVWEGWGEGIEPGRRSSFAWQGQPLPFVPYAGLADEMRGFQTGTPVRIRRPHDQGRAAHPDRVAAARIPVERYAGPLLVAGGHDDQVWDSGAMAEAIVRARDAAGRRTEAVIHRQAGHAMSGTGWSPTTQYNAGPLQAGGQPAADARAQAETFGRTLDFLRRTLAP